MTVREELKQDAILEARDILADLKEVAEKENWIVDLFIEEVINEMRRQMKGDTNERPE